MSAQADMRAGETGLAKRDAARPLREMPLAGFGRGLRSAALTLKRSFFDGTLFLPLIAVAMWALTHPFEGILGDASVYVARALADLDPSGIGRDMMFVNDGQSRFSLFPIVLDHLVAAFGTEPTAIMLAILSMAAWMAAVALYAKQFVGWRFVAVVVIFVAVLPVCYGSLWRFGYSEILAVPRPFAEALVLAALAALAAGRTGVCCVALFAASLVHPLMALAGWGVFGLVLCKENWRWRVASVLLVTLLVAAAAVGVPVLHRLLTIMSPDLKAFAESRSPLLFPTHWPVDFVGPIAVQTATVAIVASLYDGRRRMILLATILVGIGGIASQALFGDRLGVLLVIQAQLWRMAWLLAATGAIALALSALNLWRGESRGRVVIALLAMAWLSYEDPLCAGMFAAAAALSHFGLRDITFSRPVARAVWVCAIAWGFFWNLHYFHNLAHFYPSIPADGSHGMGYFWNRRYAAFPIGAAALAAALTQKRSRALWTIECVVALALLVCTVRFWDDRPNFQKIIDANRHPPGLTQLMASKSGEVLWVDGLTEGWFLAGRPQWASAQQGVSTIFSPVLAREWRERVEFLIRERLVARHALSAFHIPSAAELPKVSAAGVAHLCARPDAPAWIVAPVRAGIEISDELKPRYWHPPEVGFRMTQERDNYTWLRISNYAVLPCATTQAPRRG